MPSFLPRLLFLLRPGWIALAMVVIAFTYLCFMVLAPWQLGKNTRTSRENHQIESSLNTEPVPLKTILPQQDSSAPSAQWRRVTATGHYLADVQVLARLRVVQTSRRSAARPLRRRRRTDRPPDRGYVRPEPGARRRSPPARRYRHHQARPRDPSRPHRAGADHRDGVQQVNRLTPNRFQR
jgi:cytochrome oxidase assembly protein ShyY1